MRTPLRTVLGIVLAPAAAAAAWATCSSLVIPLGGYRTTLPLIAGALACAALYLRGGGRRLYVAAHELTHAMAAICTGIKVRKISVKGRSGYVLLDSTNAFISLAPYFIPFYTLCAATAYWTARHFFYAVPLRPWFLAVAGFTLTFHLLHTAEILSGPVQSDLKKAGGLYFSLPLLILLNCAGIALAVKLMFPEIVSMKLYLSDVLRLQAAAYQALFHIAAYCANTAKIYIRP